MSKSWLTILILSLSCLWALSAGAQEEVDDTDQEFFEEDAESEEPMPQLSEEPVEFSSDPIELDREPVPQIQRRRETVDYEQLRGPRRIQHPNAEKGLIRITKDRTYIYKVKPSDQNHAVSFRFGLFEPVNLENPETGANFEDNYPDSANPILLIEYEWQLWKSAIGKFGLKVGSGIYYANGNGRFKNNYAENQTKEPKEVFTFLAFPNSLGAVYRAQFWDRQLLVPYVDGGVIGFTFAELRDDGENPKFGFSPAAFAAAGLALNLSSFDKISAFNLDAEYGINAVYLVAEYRNIVSLGGKFDLSSDLINAGFLMEF